MVKSKFPFNLMHVLPISNLICIILDFKQFLPLAISEKSFNCRATNGHYPHCLSWTNQSNDFFNYFIFEVDQCFESKTSTLKIFCRCRIQKSRNILQKVITSVKVIIIIRVSLSDAQSELSGIYQKSGICLPPLLLSTLIVWLHWDRFREKTEQQNNVKATIHLYNMGIQV